MIFYIFVFNIQHNSLVVCIAESRCGLMLWMHICRYFNNEMQPFLQVDGQLLHC